MLVAKQYKGIYYQYEDYDERFILDENGDKIPVTICLCNAYKPSECCCAHDWSNYQDEYDYE